MGLGHRCSSSVWSLGLQDSQDTRPLLGFSWNLWRDGGRRWPARRGLPSPRVPPSFWSLWRDEGCLRPQGEQLGPGWGPLPPPAPRAPSSTAVQCEAREAGPPPCGPCRRSWGRAGRRPPSSCRRRHSGARGNPSGLQGRDNTKQKVRKQQTIQKQTTKTIETATPNSEEEKKHTKK